MQQCHTNYPDQGMSVQVGHRAVETGCDKTVEEFPVKPGWFRGC
ncbi:hypothetical protein ABH920_003931 [Catenulispora sp. EB89]